MKLFKTSLTRRLVGALALGLGMGWHVAQAQQAPQLPPGYKAEYKLSLVVGTAFPWGKGGEIWSNLVKERTNGRINIKLYPGVSLVGGDQLMDEPMAMSITPWRMAVNSRV